MIAGESVAHGRDGCVTDRRARRVAHRAFDDADVSDQQERKQHGRRIAISGRQIVGNLSRAGSILYEVLMAIAETAPAPSKASIVLAFAAVYTLWGPTYRAIRFAIQPLPPFSMASVRFLIAGVIMYVWARARGAARPTLSQWRAGFVVGGLLLVGGNGAVVWAEQRVASGLTALLAATVPLWIVIAERRRP